MVGCTEPSDSDGDGWVCMRVRACVRACVCACVHDVFAIYDNNI